MSNAFDTAENNRNNDAEIAKILALGTDREQTQQLVEDFGDSAYLFNASAATQRPGTAGTALFLQTETWPTLAYRNAGIGAVVTILGPCAINQLHVHKTTELQFNIGPGKMQSFFIENNGLTVVNNTKDAGSATLFPRSAIHMEMNTDCVPTTFISAFPDPDFERVDMAQIVQFGPDILNATFAGFGSESLVSAAAVDQGSVLRGTAECRQRCGLADDYEFAQLYPNLGYFTQEWFNPEMFYSTLSLPGADAGNATYTGSAPPPANSSTSSPLTRRHFKDVMVDSESELRGISHAYSYLTLSENPLQPVVTGLSVATLVLFVALVLSLLGFGRRKTHYMGEDKF